ncbi:MAG: glycosyltransferase [Lunatimonas sp.]|uniref:glycosyltransferase n=1 Tax=Lunatimonas sp. TaxID=2060141 RepID=UPI00263B20EF|nr:glycosyltransferase [Lunatimonas sp.]MCC5936358.1 glycosyltransferase [Lunatimonas sp.]
MLLIYIVLGVYLIAMCFVLFYSLTQAHLLVSFLRYRAHPTPVPEALPEEELPQVTVQLPIYNEQYVIKRLLRAVAQLNYPHERLEIQILDDSTDVTSEIIRRQLAKYPQVPFTYLHRSNREGFKAGALKAGLERASGEFIAVFDADFVPEPNFIRKTISHFQDPQVGMVQSRWTHINEGFSMLTRLQAFALDTHFMVEQTGRNALGAFINFNGTGGIWRKACILDAGNWESDTLTEDLDLSYRAQRRNWKFVYRADVASPAELPPLMSAIKSQQFRWTKGGAECAVKHLRQVWNADVPMRVRLHATAHLLNSTVFIAILAVSLSSIPIWWAFYKGWLPAYYFRGATVFLFGFVIIAAVYLVGNLSLKKYSWKSIGKFLWELPLFLSVSMGLSIHNAHAVWLGFWGRKTAFVRTPKYNLKKNRNAWRKNKYHQPTVSVGTYMELGMACLFTGVVLVSLFVQTYEMLLFHSMLAVGFWVVSLASIPSRRSPSLMEKKDLPAS